MSIPLASKASGQVTVVDVTDAYSVLLTSESYTFVGNTTGAPTGLSCATQVVAYCGTQQCSKITVSTVTCPTGISATISNNNTSSPTITFKTTATITQACEATIPVVVDGVTINKKFSFAVAKTGATGGKGDTGKSVSSVTTQYYVSTSKTSATGGSWSDTAPTTVEKGKYLWTRLKVVYTNPSSTEYTTATYDSMTDSRIEQLKDSITLEITGPDGVKSSIAMDDDGKIALTGDVIAQRINVDELMAQHLTSTGGLDVTGDFLVKNTYGSITQGTTASGYGFTQIDNTETIDDCEYSSSILSDNVQVNLSHRYTSSDGSADTSYVSISDILKIGSAGHIEMNSKDYIFMQSENGMTLSADNIDVWGNLSLTGTITGPTRTITVNGDLNTYYPVHIKTDCSKNDREYHLYIGKKLWTTSPAWEGNHSSGSSSLTIGWAYRANGWDECGYYNKTLYKYEPYAALISNVQFMNGSTTGVVVWLRGGGATYNIHSDTPFTATVYLDTTNIGTSNYPINVEPYTTIYNAGWYSAHTLYDYGSWTPTIADATVSSYTKQQGWYLKIGNVVTVGWYLYAKFASNQTSNKYVIQGLPYTPVAVGTGGGLCSGYYSANQVNFSGWYAHPNGRIYGYGVTNGAAGNKWAEEKIFCGTGDSYSTGTIIYTTTTS